ncbi:molybdenum cofactor biosysynthesis protein [Catellatospora methionotrophica]|uniref:Molybdenum cofactor biosysynthesis protein n=1 Tax=Catellatospora methionotrophica TaxID=121620 RepID=A0A8J3L8S7_9ACTN|nr:MOSC N-terminal beta barrel domain-containing protein [Catellatospora methionotrophica]GIG14422.1 molybdenum cofactor biosysynthesis protein [Catellatospora methionotrophica]
MIAAGAAVATLHRYPVKSLLGEQLTAADVTAAGLAGDRALALLDTATGRVASAKHPRLWQRLLTLTAAIDPRGVRITGPGVDVHSTDPAAAKTLSALLGRNVELTGTPPEQALLDRADPDAVLRDGITATLPLVTNTLGGAAPGTFFDFAPVHLLTTATLRRITALHPAGIADLRRYRPNIVIDTADENGFPEDDWVGRELHIGEAALRVIVATPRCAIPTLAHGDLPRDPDALRVLARHHRIVPLPALGPQPCAGIYAQVLHPARIRPGDPVRVA